MPEPIKMSATFVDMSTRYVQSSTVAASPAAGSITTIGSVAIPNFGDLTIVSGVIVEGQCSFTVGTSGVSATLAIKQTNSSGTTVCTTGATTVVAGNLYTLSVNGFDTTPGVGTYALCLTIGSGAATSTVSQLQVNAFAI